LNVYDAIYEAVAERLGIEPDKVRHELVHREIPDDSFWHAWDEAVAEATALYERVTNDEASRADWKYEVANDDTTLGFAEWKERQAEVA
jgi:hypothetical protein